MIALPSAPAPAPRRQLLVGTAVACAAGAALLGGMLALYLRFREAAIDSGASWVPDGINIPLVPATVMLCAFIPVCVFAQWAVYSAKRDDRPHTGLALGLVALIGIAYINAQAHIYAQMELPANDGTFSAMFYAITGAFAALVIVGVVFSAVTAFRYLGGRSADREILAAHALYWYFLSAAFCALWLVVYVTK